MIIRRHSGREISPSIISKAKHALGLKRSTPLNDKLCSRELWEETIEILGERMECPRPVIDKAKEQYEYYMQPYFI